MPEPGPEPETDLRRAFAAFATGVTVVTAARPDGPLSGLTVNSFSSVSLSPRLLLWCLGEECDRYAHFAAVEHWGVTILGAADRALALRFSRAATDSIAAEDADFSLGAPVLKPGLAHFACRTFDRRAAGDHLIVIGEVMDFRVAPGDGLTFFRGRYGAIPDPNGD
jgi:flavin reductase (DIM6/NTAB) family NADH-FMN oxidoreductase RutF